MSLAGLRRMSCTLFPSACGCKPSGAIFCSPAARVTRPMKTANSLPTGAIRMMSAGKTPDKTENTEPVPFKERVKLMWTKYGRLAIVTYLGVYVGTLSTLFFTLDFDVFNAATFGFDHSAAIEKVSRLFCGVYFVPGPTLFLLLPGL